MLPANDYEWTRLKFFAYLAVNGTLLYYKEIRTLFGGIGNSAFGAIFSMDGLYGYMQLAFPACVIWLHTYVQTKSRVNWSSESVKEEYNAKYRDGAGRGIEKWLKTSNVNDAAALRVGRIALGVALPAAAYTAFAAYILPVVAVFQLVHLIFK